MKKDIQEEKSEGSLGKYISAIHRYIHIFLEKELEKYKIGRGEQKFLWNIIKNDGIAQHKLSEKFKIDKATVTRGVKKLIIEGYITRERDENDKRAYNLYLTKKGKDMKPILKKTLENVTYKISEGFTEEEEKTFKRLLKKAFENLKK